MKIFTATAARKQLPQLINTVYYSHRPIAIGHRQKAEVLMIRFPEKANLQLDEITNMNQYGGAFDFLDMEPDLYSRNDIG